MRAECLRQHLPCASQGRFPRLDDRDDLWRLLVAITEHKAADQVRRARRQKRGGGRVRTEGDLTAGGSDDQPAGLNAIAGTEPTPEFAEEYRRLFEALPTRSCGAGKKGVSASTK